MSEVRAVLLDLYDTLVWSRWPAMRGELEERLGISTADLLRAYTTTRAARSVGAFGSAEGDVTAVLEAAGARPDPSLAAELTRRTQEFLLTGVTLHEDSVPVLRELRRRGVRTAVVSNCDHTTRPVVERLGLYGETDAVVLSFEERVAKPDPGIYLAALERLGVEAADAVFVDDQAGYCDGAAAVGVRALLILRDGAAPAEGVSAPGGHRVIRDLRTLLDLP
ncbi:MAG: HAD family hydrolase [Actinomycetota bacterium]